MHGIRTRANIVPLELPRPITIVLVDDQRAYRDGLARAIVAHCRLELVAVADRGNEALDVIEALQPDVALIDVRMDGLMGNEVCEILRRRHPDLETRLILMSAYGNPELDSEAVAHGFVAKDRSRREICEALVQVAQRSPRRALAPVD